MDKNIIKQYLPDNPIIIDAGAYDGADSIDFANMFPNGIIYAFEPVSNIYNQLVENTKNYKNIKTYKLALSDTTVNKKIYVSSGYSVQSSSLLKPKNHLQMFPDCKFESEEVVKTTTINKFCADNKINRIDFMWLDLQGNETKVIKKADKILHTTKAIFAEYSLVEFYEGVLLYDDFKKFMKELGFKEVFNENTYNYVGCGNSLFIREE